MSSCNSGGDSDSLRAPVTMTTGLRALPYSDGRASPSVVKCRTHRPQRVSAVPCRPNFANGTSHGRRKRVSVEYALSEVVRSFVSSSVPQTELKPTAGRERRVVSPEAVGFTGSHVAAFADTGGLHNTVLTS